MALPSPPPSAPSGELVAGRYQLERRIGQGGMAEVWVATDSELDRKVAIKWLKAALATDPVVAERFRREAIAVARLSHPNIVAVHDACLHEGRQAVIMQLVDGKSLRQLLDSQKRLGPELTIHIGACIASALDEAHRAGFVHRDVKPANILVTSDGRVLLTDFGIAKGLQSGDDDLTSDNVMMGTAKYLSPEQVRGKRLDGRADLYSLGLVLYECLAGRVPFLGESDADTALARLQRDPTDLAHLRPTLPIGLVNLIHQTLARNPAHRPQSGADLRSALLAVDTSPPLIDGTPIELPERLASPPKRAHGAGPGIPGEPGAVVAPPTIPNPVVDTDRTPEAETVRPTGPRRDPTPPANQPVRGAPARRHQQRWTPSLVIVGTLIVASLAVATALLVSVNRGDQADPGPTPTGPAPASSSPAVPNEQGEAPAPDAGPAGPAGIAGITAWDPDGDNGTENDEQAALALADGVASTYWATECYQDRYLGGKRGVGLIVRLSAPGTGVLDVTTLNAPFQLDVYLTAAPTPPADLAGWTPIGETRYADEAQALAFEVTTAATHLLVWLHELGPDEDCSSANPYRGRLAEIGFRP